MYVLSIFMAAAVGPCSGLIVGSQPNCMWKGWFTLKYRFCHHLLTLMLFQTHAVLFFLNCEILASSFPFKWTVINTGDLMKSKKHYNGPLNNLFIKLNHH